MTDRSPLEKEMILISISICTGLIIPPAVWLLVYSVRRVFSLVLTFSSSTPHHIGLLIPSAVMLALSAITVTLLAPEAEGPGLHIVIASYFRRGGRLRPRTAPSKFLSTLLCVGSGTANGLVSPLTLIGAGMSSITGRVLRLGEDEQKTISLSGVAAALSTLLGAPLGAAIFAVEMVYGNRILYRRFFYPLLASLTAYLLSLFLGLNPPYMLAGESSTLTPGVAIATLFVAVGVVALNIGYITLYQRVHDALSRVHRRTSFKWVLPLSGSLLALLILLPVYPTLLDLNVVGGGRLEPDSLKSISPHMLLLSTLLIMLSTSLLSGSGGSGGLFMPVFTLGALTGYWAGSLLYPNSTTIFIAAGISAALSTTLNVPLAAAILSIEILGGWAALPAATGSLMGYLLARRFIIYHEIRWKELR